MENITEVLMESIAKVEKIIAAEEPAPGDYEKDGLLYCGFKWHGSPSCLVARRAGAGSPGHGLTAAVLTAQQPYHRWASRSGQH